MKNITIICNVKDDEDLINKIHCITEQIYREIQIVFLLEGRDNICALQGAKAFDYEIIAKSPSIGEILDISKGYYFIFLDEADTFSIDYCRMLMDKAISTNSDIVAADIAYFDEEKGTYCYSNLSPLRSKSIEYDGKSINELYDKYGKYSADFGIIYGKLIKKELLAKNAIASRKIDACGIYDEIIKNCSRFSNVHGAYYYKHAFSGEDKKSYLNSIMTPICFKYREYEELKKYIASDECKIVSFDVFDTLILRNVYKPKDLFAFLNEDFAKLFSSNALINFAEMREKGEEVCRKRVKKIHPEYEDVSFDEIYDTISRLYEIDQNVLEKIKKREIELELEFCFERLCAKDIYKLAKYCDKRVVCTSDMYLPSSVIKEILHRSGYDIEEIYVSSETRVTKASGKAFERLPHWVGSKKNEIIHIGDNYESDVSKAKKAGIKTFHLPKVKDLFWGEHHDSIKGMAARHIFGSAGLDNDYFIAVQNNIGLRCLLAPVINTFYDNPYTGFNCESDFDADPYCIGFFALGMHLYALADWISNEAKNYSKIHFLSRDGYSIKAAYDIVNSTNDNAVPSVYTYMSRNIIVLGDIQEPKDLWAFRDKLQVYEAEPQKLVKYLKPGISDASAKKIEQELSENGIQYTGKIVDEEAFSKTIHIIGKNVDWDKLSIYRAKLKDYFSNIFGPNECIVDAGYNGRVEAAIAHLCGIQLTSFYFHVSQDVFYRRQTYYRFDNKCFYQEHPITSYLVREQFVSKIAPSVKEVVFSDGSAQIVFGDIDTDIFTEYITNTIQEAAIEYVQRVVDIFGNKMELLKCRYHDASRPFDYLCNHGKDIDISIFKCTEFEDDFGVGKTFNLSEYWRSFIDNSNVQKYDHDNMKDYEIFKKYYLKAEKFLPKESMRRALIRKVVKTILAFSTSG